MRIIFALIFLTSYQDIVKKYKNEGMQWTSGEKKQEQMTPASFKLNVSFLLSAYR
jgi:hypothetical protein